MFSRSRRTALFLLFAAAVPIYVLVVSTRPVRPATQRPSDLGGEAARVEAHIARVEGELRDRDVHALSPAQRLARRVQIARLHEYRLRGRYPHNHDFRGRRVSYFADRHGTLCAMAHLIEASGRSDIVSAVRARSNNARVTELAADPELGPTLIAWLEGAGLTVAEAQRIQPAYEYATDEESHTPTGYGLASGAFGAANLVSIGVNGGRAVTGRGPAWISPVGIVAGAGQMALGAASLGKEGERQVLGIANVVVGFTSLVVSALAVKKRDASEASTPTNATPPLAVHPTVYGHAAVGLALGIRASF